MVVNHFKDPAQKERERQRKGVGRVKGHMEDSVIEIVCGNVLKNNMGWMSKTSTERCLGGSSHLLFHYAADLYDIYNNVSHFSSLQTKQSCCWHWHFIFFTFTIKEWYHVFHAGALFFFQNSVEERYFFCVTRVWTVWKQHSGVHLVWLRMGGFCRVQRYTWVWQLRALISCDFLLPGHQTIFVLDVLYNKNRRTTFSSNGT